MIFFIILFAFDFGESSMNFISPFFFSFIFLHVGELLLVFRDLKYSFLLFMWLMKIMKGRRFLYRYKNILYINDKKAN